MLEKNLDMYLGTIEIRSLKGAEKYDGLLGVKAFYEHTPYLHDREILLLPPTFRCITYKKVGKPAKEIPDKETTVDPIRCLAVTDETGPLRLRT